MHTEHLQNVKLTRVFMAWFIGIAAASLATFALLAAGLMSEDPTAANTWWSAIAVAVGFFAAGFWAGFRAVQAPVLHAMAIGVTSLLAWFVLNLLAKLFFPAWDWASMTPELAIGLLLAQFAAAAVGALLGYNMALRGRPGLSE